MVQIDAYLNPFGRKHDFCAAEFSYWNFNAVYDNKLIINNNKRPV